MILAVSDFVGSRLISVAYGSNALQAFINKNEPQLIMDLLGVEMGQELIEDNDLFPELQEPFSIQVQQGDIYHSQGLKQMLIDFIFAMFPRENATINTSGGTQKLKQEGGESVTNYIKPYNDAVHTYWAIQAFIKENKADYPNYKGVEKEFTWYF
jgi:hypothetical protein